MRIEVIGSAGDGIGILQRDRNVEARPLVGGGLYGHLPAKELNALLDDPWRLPGPVTVRRQQAAAEGKAAAVVVDRQPAHAVVEHEADEDVLGAAVLPHV